MSATPNCVMFSAATVLQFQTPPYERTAPDEVLLLCRREERDGQISKRWDFPRVGEIDYPAELEPWTDGAFRARVDAPFDPPGVSRGDFSWVCQELAITVPASVYGSNVLSALRRFDGALIDQVLARAEALADSNSQGVSMGTSTAELQRQLDALKRQIGPPMTDEQRREYRDAQAKADRVAQVYGDSAAPPLAGESLHDYRVRLATPYQQYSKIFKASNLYKIFDPSALSAVEDAIYNDAMREAQHPTGGFRPGELRAVHTPDATGRKITKYYGDPAACWSQFNPPIRHVTKFMT